MTDPTKRFADGGVTDDSDPEDGESRRETIAEMLDDVATRLHEKADAGAERVTDIGHQAAEKVEATAQYVRDHDSLEMISDVEYFVKKHPVKSILAVAVMGFLLGRAFRRD